MPTGKLRLMIGGLFVAVCLWLLSAQHQAVHALLATNVGGVITTNITWTQVGSPYILTAETIVQQGVKLTIEPGVVISGNNYSLIINGELQAIGTQAKLITFEGLKLKSEPEPKVEPWSSMHIEYAQFFDSEMQPNEAGFILRDSLVQQKNLSDLSSMLGKSNR